MLSSILMFCHTWNAPIEKRSMLLQLPLEIRRNLAEIFCTSKNLFPYMVVKLTYNISI